MLGARRDRELGGPYSERRSDGTPAEPLNRPRSRRQTCRPLYGVSEAAVCQRAGTLCVTSVAALPPVAATGSRRTRSGTRSGCGFAPRIGPASRGASVGRPGPLGAPGRKNRPTHRAGSGRAAATWMSTSLRVLQPSWSASIQSVNWPGHSWRAANLPPPAASAASMAHRLGRCRPPHETPAARGHALSNYRVMHRPLLPSRGADNVACPLPLGGAGPRWEAIQASMSALSRPCPL
jgi:hypothetical protein